jgi:hypothetical protein
MTLIKVPDIDDPCVLRNVCIGSEYRARILLWDTHEPIHQLSRRMNIAFAFWPNRSYKTLFVTDKLDVFAAEPESDRSVVAALSYVLDHEVCLLTPHQKEWQRSQEADYFRDLLDGADSSGRLESIIHNVWG